VTLVPALVCGCLALIAWMRPALRAPSAYGLILLAFVTLPVASVASFQVRCWAGSDVLRVENEVNFVCLIASGSRSCCIQVYSCERFDDGSAWLRADYTLDCDTSDQRTFEAFAALMIGVWPLGFPSLFAVLLHKHRHALQRPQVELKKKNAFGLIQTAIRNLGRSKNLHGAVEATLVSLLRTDVAVTARALLQALRHGDPSLAALRLLFEGYQPQFYFWELISTARRLFLIGVLVVVAQVFGDTRWEADLATMLTKPCRVRSRLFQGNVLQLAVGVFVSLASTTLQSRYWPFAGPLENAFALACEWLIFFALFLG